MYSNAIGKLVSFLTVLAMCVCAFSMSLAFSMSIQAQELTGPQDTDTETEPASPPDTDDPLPEQQTEEAPYEQPDAEDAEKPVHLSASADGLSLEACTDAFSSPVTMNITSIDQTTDQGQSLLTQLSPDNAYTAALYTVSFVNGRGEPVAPSSPVSVSMRLDPSVLADSDRTSVTILNLQPSRTVLAEGLTWPQENGTIHADFMLTGTATLAVRSPKKSSQSSEPEPESAGENSEASGGYKWQTLYCYAMLPGYKISEVSGEGQGSWHAADWRGMGYTKVLMPEADTQKDGTTFPIDALPADASIDYPDPSNPNFYPDITFTDKSGQSHTYTFARPGSGHENDLGYYSVRWVRLRVVDDGAFPDVPDATGHRHTLDWGWCYHLDGVIILNVDTTCTVTFNVLQPGTSEYQMVSAQTVKRGLNETDLERPADYVPGEPDPDKPDWVMTDWYTDKDCTKKADFTGKVDGNLNLYARFRKTEPLNVRNIVYGTPAEKDAEYNYDLVIPEDASYPEDTLPAVKVLPNGTEEALTLYVEDGECSFTLSGGEKLEISTLLEDGETYSLTQTTCHGLSTWAKAAGDFEQTEQNPPETTQIRTAYGDDSCCITFFNECFRTLTVTKKVTGNGARKGESFPFALDLGGKQARSAPDSLTWDDSAGLYRFSLQDGQSIEDIIIPCGMAATLSETDSKGYAAAVSVDDGAAADTASVTLSMETNHQVAFRNNRTIKVNTDLHSDTTGKGLWLLGGSVALATGFLLASRRRRHHGRP